jgi:hypothetical protein
MPKRISFSLATIFPPSRPPPVEQRAPAGDAAIIPIIAQLLELGEHVPIPSQKQRRAGSEKAGFRLAEFARNVLTFARGRADAASRSTLPADARLRRALRLRRGHIAFISRSRHKDETFTLHLPLTHQREGDENG